MHRQVDVLSQQLRSIGGKGFLGGAKCRVAYNICNIPKGEFFENLLTS